MNKKPKLNFWQIWNLSFGFLGVQIGYSLQSANTSRIFQSLGADVHEISYFWLAAPIAGFIVQPLIGLFSDRVWTPLGRRIPFILGGAIFATLALILMPNAEFFTHLFPPLIFAAIMLLFMDVAFNATMQPFRALVADKLDDSQKNRGYSVQTFLINVGAVVGSLLPFILTNYFGFSNEGTAENRVPDSVAWSYYIGGALLLLTVLVTAFKTKEYPPELHNKYNNVEGATIAKPKLGELIRSVPKVMIQLGVVQFFSWAALFLMWTYTTPAIAQSVWGTTDSSSALYQEAGDWVGVIFAIYSVFSALFALVLTRLSNKFSNKAVYGFSLILGAISFMMMPYISDKYMLVFPMIGIGVAWAAILAMPYAILSRAIPSDRMGVYMGIFNFTITIPQIVCGLLGGAIVGLFDGDATAMIMVAGVCFLLAAMSVVWVKDKKVA